MSLHEWSRRTRFCVSVALAVHLIALFVGPWSAPPPSTQLSRDIAAVLRPYIKLVALDNGYRFFAPNPGPSHLIRYELRMENGETEGGNFPDPNVHWPRLFYHRHFMLSESLFGISAPVLDPPSSGMSDSERQAFDDQKEQAKLLQEAVAQHLLRQHVNATSVRLFMQVHSIPSHTDVLQGRPLDDPALTEEFLLGQFSKYAR